MKNIFQDILDLFRRAPLTSNPRVSTATTDKLPPPSEASTAPLSEEELASITRQSQLIQPQQLIVGASRNVGLQRGMNEDALLAHTTLIDTNDSSIPFGIFIVADGMGGHKNGDLASEYAVRAMVTHLFKHLHSAIFGPEPHSPEESLQEIIRNGINQAHRIVNMNAPGGGTTLTVALVIGTQMTLGHVGDSRAYAVYLDGRMQTLTRDHSLVKRLEELGQITPEEAASHPQKSLLYNALGQGDPPKADIFTASLPHPGYLMICSDGLWGVVPEDEIFSIIISAPNPQQACQNLIDAANAAGGPDNISVILARMSD